MDLNHSRQIGNLSLRLVQMCMESGLSWDDAVIACAIAGKTLAMQASCQGGGTQAECMARMQTRFTQGIEQTSAVLQTWLQRNSLFPR